MFQVADLTMGDLLVHKPVTWINPPSALVKSKKDPELAAFGTASASHPGTDGLPCSLVCRGHTAF